MLFSNIAYLDENYNIQEGFIQVEGEKIVYVGKTRPENYTGGGYSGKGKLLMPAFYNAHAHSPMSILRGYGENLTLDRWLQEKIFPFEAKLTGEGVYWGTMLSMAESLKFGIASTSDMYYMTPHVVEAFTESGAKANISRSLVNFTGEAFETMESFKETQDAVRQYHKTSNGRILIDASIHGEYTSNEETVRGLSAYAKEQGINMHIHLSETEKEHKECMERHNGLTPAAYFAECGAFDVNASAAHCVWVTEEDMDILRDKKVTVVTNPVSNMKLASGICPTAEILKKSINLAIGTDGDASNNNLNFQEEMKLLALGAKVKYMDPTVITPEEVLKAATLGGAIAQGRQDCGVLKTGNKADLIVMDISSANMNPVHNLVNNIVYSSTPSDIKLTMVDGKVLYKDGEYTTIDIEKTIFKVKEAKERIVKSLG